MSQTPFGDFTPESAEDFSEEETKGEETERRGFRCLICLELMRWEKEPRSLPCGHSFCSDCLNKLFFSQQTPTAPDLNIFSPPQSSSSSSSSSSNDPNLHNVEKKGCCPVCRKMIEGCERIESFDSNYLIPETIDVLESSKVPLYETKRCVNFEKCGERTSMYCGDCNLFICDSCEQSHSSSVFTRNHKRENRQEEERDQQHGNGDGGEGLMALKKRHCSAHPSDYLSAFCFECSLFVCVNCVLGVHGDHRQNVCSLEESVLRRRNEILKIGVGLEKRLKFVEKKTKTMEQEITELEEKLVKKRVMKKDLELEEDDLRIRCDAIVRLSETPTSDSIFDEDVFSTFLQIANDLIDDLHVSFSNRKKGVIGDRINFAASFLCDEKPWGIVENVDGNFIVGHHEGKLGIRNKDGHLIRTLKYEMDGGFLDVAIGVNDEIVGLNQQESKVMVLDEEGHLIRSFGSEGSEPGQFNKPCGIAVDGKGRIIVADNLNNRIQVFSYNGCFIRSFGTEGSSEGQFNHPRCAVVDGDGNLVISDSRNHRIQVMGIEGNFIRTFGERGSKDSQLSNPLGVSVDGNGRIVVVEWGNERVSVFEKDGTFLFSFGSGKMKRPSRVAIHSSGSILVSEPDQKSLQLWKNGCDSLSETVQTV